jgi:hypothetical protein
VDVEVQQAGEDIGALHGGLFQGLNALAEVEAASS